MERKILITINGRYYYVGVNDDLDTRLKRILKDEYQFNNDGILNLEEKSLESNFQIKQLLLLQLLNSMPQNQSPEVAKRLSQISSFTSPRNTVYYSDLQELENLYTETTEIYNGILNGNYKPKDSDKTFDVQQKLAQSEDAKTSLDEDNPGDNVVSKPESSNDSSDSIQESEESSERDYVHVEASADSSDDLKEALKEAAKAPELQEYITEEKIDEVVKNVRVAKSNQEFRAETGKDERTFNVKEYVREAQSQNREIVLPPVDNIEDVAVDVYATLSNNEKIDRAVDDYKKRKKTFNNGIQSSFNNLRSSFKLKGGINSRNLNSFGNDFLTSYIELCRETGTNPEEMFRDYFSNSNSTRQNSILNKFITQFIVANGGDQSLRDLIETTLVKKAIASNLISTRYNNYLKEGYRELSFNGNGTINFDLKTEVETEINADAKVTNETNIRGASVPSSVNGEVNLNAKASSDISLNGAPNIGSNAINGEVRTNRPNIPRVPNVNGNITQNIPGTKLNENDGTAGARRDLENLNSPMVNNLGSVPNMDVTLGKEANNPLNSGALSNISDNDLAGASVGVPSLSTPSLGEEYNPSMELAQQRARQKNNYAQNNGKRKNAGSPLSGSNNKLKNLRKRTDKQDLITGSGLRKNNLLNPKTMNELEAEDELQNDVNPEESVDTPQNTANNIPNSNNTFNNASETSPDNPIQDVADNLKKEGAKKLGAVILEFIKKNPWVVVIGGIFLLVLLLILMAGNTEEQPKMMGLGGYSYLKLANVCEEIYVYDTPSGVDGTYPLEEYVAGVVAHEVGAFNNDTLYEVFAIAARTYALNRLQSSGSCSIKGNSTAQVFGKTDNERIIEAANKTRGLVLTRNGSMISTEYDAFCWDTKDDNYYYVCQKNYDTGENLKVPVDWATEHVGRITGQAFLTNPRYHSHGRGISQDGAWYMATELNYDKDQIFTFFFGSEAKIMSIYASSYSGEYPLNPNDELYQNLSFLINESFESFLNRNGTSVEEFNTYLNDIATNSGLGTRESVVNVAVSFIGSLANMGYKLNYQWGGRYDMAGVNANWGTSSRTACSTAPNVSSCNTNFVWSSMDCNGFVNWVYANAFGTDEYRKRGIYNKTKTQNAKRVALDANKGVCEAGDTLINPGSHIVLVVGKDDTLKKYIVAESTGSNIVRKTGGVKLSYYSYNASGYFCSDMSSIYAND